jgi:hypothetical protein
MPAPISCGSDAGYQQHRAYREVPCPRCSRAHALTMAWYRLQNRPVDPLLYAAARAGMEPAEALTTGDRARLVAELATRGWTDRRIAEHTRMTTYTTARIRGRLGLTANHLTERSAA